MPRPKRADEANCIYQALNRGNAKSVIFNKPADFNAFERIVAKRLEHYPCRILCMMGHRDRDMSTRDDSKAFPCRTTNIFSWSLGILSETPPRIRLSKATAFVVLRRRGFGCMPRLRRSAGAFTISHPWPPWLLVRYQNLQFP